MNQDRQRLQDDLEIGGEIVSDDERFLQIVKAARGDLVSIRRGLEQAGMLSDDFSVIRIAFSAAHAMKNRRR